MATLVIWGTELNTDVFQVRILTTIAFLLFGWLPAQAALIDNGTYTSDTESGLDWLDFSETVGLSYTASLAANSGWRLATNPEVTNLVAVAFDGFYETDSLGYSYAP